MLKLILPPPTLVGGAAGRYADWPAADHFVLWGPRAAGAGVCPAAEPTSPHGGEGAAQQLHRFLTRLAERAAPTSGATLERKNTRRSQQSGTEFVRQSQQRPSRGGCSSAGWWEPPCTVCPLSPRRQPRPRRPPPRRPARLRAPSCPTRR